MSFGRGGGGRMGHLFGPDDALPIPKERRGRTIRRIASFFGPYRLAVSAVLLTIVVTSLLGLVNPYLLKLLIDEALPQRDLALLNLFVGLMIVIPIVSGLIGVGQSYL
ncbi:MAG: ABC transporter ATP-binding protein, partial [Candidatus Limnocylindrales bacterium]